LSQLGIGEAKEGEGEVVTVPKSLDCKRDNQCVWVKKSKGAEGPQGKWEKKEKEGPVKTSRKMSSQTVRRTVQIR